MFVAIVKFARNKTDGFMEELRSRQLISTDEQGSLDSCMPSLLFFRDASSRCEIALIKLDSINRPLKLKSRPKHHAQLTNLDISNADRTRDEFDQTQPLAELIAKSIAFQ